MQERNSDLEKWRIGWNHVAIDDFISCYHAILFYLELGYDVMRYDMLSR